MIFTDRVHRFFRKLAEWYLDRPKPGPTIPGHYEIIVTDFANFNPRATRGEWHRFALSLANNAYTEGYWAHAREEVEIDTGKPDIVASQLDPDWREHVVDLENPDLIVKEHFEEPMLSADEIARVSRR